MKTRRHHSPPASVRRSADDILREERDFVSAVLETAAALVVVMDTSGRIVRFNRACEELTGYRADEVIGRRVGGLLMEPGEAAGFGGVLAKLGSDETPCQHESTWLTKSGGRRLIAWSCTKLTNPDGSLRHIVGVGIDITQRHADEQRRFLEFEMARLLAASDSLAETVPALLKVTAETFQWDVGEFWAATDNPGQTRVIHVWHAPGERLRKFVEHSLKVSLPMFDGLPGRVMATGEADWIADISRHPRMLRRRAAARAGLRTAMAFPILLIDRVLGVMAFLAHREAEPDRELLRMFVTLGRQIGQFMERKRAEEALQLAEERFRLALQASRIGTVEVDLTTGQAYWNDVAFELLGLKPGEAPPEFETFLRHVHPDDVPRVKLLYENALRTGEFDAEFRILRADGTERWLAGKGRFAFAGPHRTGARAVRFLGVNYDVTERRRLEAELLEIADREQQRIGHDLHDGLGQQLTGLEMKSYGLMEDLTADDLPERRGRLREQARQLNEGLRDCISVTRSIVRGLAPVVLNAEGLAGALHQLAARTDGAGGVRCRFICRRPVHLGNSQRANHLYRIAQEALNNALKHARAGWIRIHLNHVRDRLVLRIADGGRGMVQRRGAGAGMGLEVMRHRANVIGASLEIDTTPGRGVRITCTLPLKSP